MNVSSGEINLLKKTIKNLQIEIKKYKKYQEETTDPGIQNAFHQITTAKIDHLILMKTILNRVSKGEK
ncbi:hypothetical protein [Candidatus Contubernalis alkaliaceticus]|uniref:hypothetical protein n=1 Tax=Candidatus Contubernalis alkaliaceticus TaxID=338645 RepID=UPI001F4C1933|nr:hypothetical protein [Candidatus Contubernalis alkalaceticus]UNC91880.1 hypothetical protein HUE98_07080 [Candidatus Contubernalis alkalaceticus]